MGLGGVSLCITVFSILFGGRSTVVGVVVDVVVGVVVDVVDAGVVVGAVVDVVVVGVVIYLWWMLCMSLWVLLRTL